jgi:hypothetical protein
MVADTPLKVGAAGLWRSSSEQPELLMIRELEDDSPNIFPQCR